MKRTSKKLSALILSLIMIITALPMTGITAFAESGVAINETNFPDKNFRAYVKKDCDKDGNGVLSDKEIKAVENISVIYKEISSLEGIEYFTALTKLNCTSNHLTSLDVSKNTALEELNCCNNKLTSLDVRKNTALKVLAFSINQLTDLDVSKNTALKTLACDSNQLTNLDVSNNIKLERLYCDNNQLTSLDVTNNITLIWLYCDNNQLTSLDISKNTGLQYLECYNNQLTSFDASKNTLLKDLWCSNNQFTIELDENNCFNLSTLPGNFDVSKSSEWNGGSVKDNILTVNDGVNEVTYTYDLGNGETETFLLVIANPISATVSSISVQSKPTKTVYTVGETFNLNGLSIKVNMSDGTSKTITSGFSISSPDMTTAGTKIVTVTYEGKTTSFTITVNNPPATVSSISVQSKPSKTVYTVGETFNLSGLSIKVNMSDGTSKTITSGFSVSEPDMKTSGTKSVTVTYEGKTTTFTITVNNSSSEKLGDVNGDGKISIVDAKAVLQSIAGTKTLTEAQTAAADLNKDGKITIIDAKWILQIVAGTRDAETLKMK